MTVLLVTKLFVLCVIFLCGPDPSPHSFIFFNIKGINFGALKFYKQTGIAMDFIVKVLCRYPSSFAFPLFIPVSSILSIFSSHQPFFSLS